MLATKQNIDLVVHTVIELEGFYAGRRQVVGINWREGKGITALLFIFLWAKLFKCRTRVVFFSFRSYFKSQLKSLRVFLQSWIGLDQALANFMKGTWQLTRGSIVVVLILKISEESTPQHCHGSFMCTQKSTEFCGENYLAEHIRQTR